MAAYVCHRALTRSSSLQAPSFRNHCTWGNLTPLLSLTLLDFFVLLPFSHVYDFLGEIALAVQLIPPIPTHFSAAWSVCLSVVCHIRTLCSNRSTDLDAIWQIHLGVQ